MALKGSALYVILLAGAIQALSLVGIFAPNALSVVPGNPVNASLLVPVVALDSIPVTTSSYSLRYENMTSDSYMGPSSTFDRLARGVLDGGSVFPWRPPARCGRACSYDVNYWGPALKCTDIPQSSIAVSNTNFMNLSYAKAAVAPGIQVSNPTHFLQGAYVYNATISPGDGISWELLPDPNREAPVPTFQSFEAYDQPFSFDVVYATNNFTLPFAQDTLYYSLTGLSCAFHNATYIASVNYSNGSQRTSARVIEFGAQLGPIPMPELRQPGPIPMDFQGLGGEFLSTYAALSLANAMFQYVYGGISFSKKTVSDGSEATLVPVYTSVLNSIFTAHTTVGGDPGPIEAEDNNISLTLLSASYDNLARLLEDACTNLTASLMSDAADLELYTLVQAAVIADTTEYKYQVSRLWLVYGIALSVALAANVLGLLCIFQNGGAMQRTFSSIAASVRSHELDALLSDPRVPLSAHAQRVGLRYHDPKSGQGEFVGFMIAEEVKGADGDLEMSERTALTEARE